MAVKEDWDFMERISRDLEREATAKRIARAILGVDEQSGKEELKRAYREAALMYHPDKNAGDTEAARRFELVRCAYEFLTKGKCADELFGARFSDGRKIFPEDKKYRLDNPWGYFLWWREKYF